MPIDTIRGLFLAAALLPSLAVVCQPAWADWSDGTFSIQIENDRIAQTDRHYTNGLRLSWVSDKAEQGPEWAKEALDALYPLAAIKGGRVGFAIGQNMYTPEDTDTRQLIPDERPYAGWLYVGFSVHAETTRIGAGGWNDTLDSVELQLGVVGPQAFAEEAQNTWHGIIGVAEANGWDNQLDFEPGVVLAFQRTWRPAPYRLGPMEVDFVPNIGGAVGNVVTFASVGSIFRFGQGLDVDYGPPLIGPSLSGIDAVEPGRDFGWYFFAGAEGRAVLRNIFLDGNTFSDSHSVDREVLVGDLRVGAAVFVHGLRLAFTHVYRTKEFQTQRRADRYGALTVSYRF